jgi:hypothetical protein
MTEMENKPSREPVFEDSLIHISHTHKNLQNLLALLEDINFIIDKDLTSHGVPRKTESANPDKPKVPIGLKFELKMESAKTEELTEACLKEAQILKNKFKIP